jgi:hypothetical protein
MESSCHSLISFLLLFYSCQFRDSTQFSSKLIGWGPETRPYTVDSTPIQWVPGVKRQGREVNHSPPSSAQVKNGGAIPYTICLHEEFCLLEYNAMLILQS